MRGRLVAFNFGAGVHGEGACTAFGDGLRVFQSQRFVVEAEAHFAGERDVRGQGFAQGFDDGVHALRLFEQHRAALVFVDRGRGAAEIEVDFFRAETHRFERVGGHVWRVAAQKLNGAGDARGGAAAVRHFGRVFEPGGAGMHGVGDADELAHAFVEAADAGEQIAHRRVGQPLHRGEDKVTGWFGHLLGRRARAKGRIIAEAV